MPMSQERIPVEILTSVSSLSRTVRNNLYNICSSQSVVFSQDTSNRPRQPSLCLFKVREVTDQLKQVRSQDDLVAQLRFYFQCPCLSSASHLVMKYLKTMLIFSLRRQFIMAGVAQHQEDEPAGYIASTVRDHKGVDAGAQLPLSLFFQFYSTQTCAVIQKQWSQPSMDEKNETCQTLNCNKFI